MNALKEILKQPFWVVVLIVGAFLTALPFVTIDKDNHFTTHPATSAPLLWIGGALLIFSAVVFLLNLQLQRQASAGLDLNRVKERGGVFSTSIGGCEISVVTGRIEEVRREPSVAVVLPCNEYFDDRCIRDPKSALGSYVKAVFDDQEDELLALIQSECKRQLGGGSSQQKTVTEQANSYGTGQCILIQRPLHDNVPIALVSTTTQRAGVGLSGRISYLFDGMRRLVRKLADERIDQALMPVLGAGHGNLSAPMAFVGLLLAIAEAARYGQGGQRLKRVTVVVFKSDNGQSVDPAVIRRALALVSSTD